MLMTVFLIAGDNVTTLGKIVQTIALMAFFLPFSYFMDTMVWRAAQRRLATHRRDEEALGSRAAAVVALARPRREQEQDPRTLVARERVPLVGIEAKEHARRGIDRLTAGCRFARCLRGRSPTRSPSPGGRPSPDPD